MSGKIDRRTFLKRSGLGLAAVSLTSLLGGCTRKYDPLEFPEFWKVGNFLPVNNEVTETGLVVEGSIPPDLSGLYVRNGPNAWQGSTAHFFMGDGMLHGVHLENGQAKWYSNRYVQTPLLYKEPGLLLSPPALEDNMSNVSLIHHGGKLLSLGEAA